MLPATGEEFAIEIRFFKYFTLKKVLGPNKYKPIMYLKFGHHAFWFLETFVKKLSFNLINLIANVSPTIPTYPISFLQISTGVFPR